MSGSSYWRRVSVGIGAVVALLLVYFVFLSPAQLHGPRRREAAMDQERAKELVQDHAAVVRVLKRLAGLQREQEAAVGRLQRAALTASAAAQVLSLRTADPPAPPRRQRILFVHLRQLNLQQGCDVRLLDLMKAAVALGFLPTYVALSRPTESTLPIDGSLCEAAVTDWASGQVSAKHTEPLSGSRRSIQGLDGVAEFAFQGTFCEGVVWALQLMSQNCFTAVIAPVWFWDCDAVPGHLFPAVQQADTLARMNRTKRRLSSPLLLALSDDAHTIRERKLASSEVCRPLSERFSKRADKVSLMERRVYLHSDAAVFISSADLQSSQSLLPRGCTGLVCNAVPAPATPIPHTSPGWRERRGLLFVGNGQNPTNFQGVRWFLDEVWPLVRQQLPKARFTLVGLPPGGFLCDALGCACGWGDRTRYSHRLAEVGVRVLGVRGDHEIAEECRRARIFVAPVVNATGVITKSFQAYQNHLPLVFTNVAASGLDKPLSSLGAIATRVDAQEFADAVVSLHESESKWTDVRNRMQAASERWSPSPAAFFDEVARYVRRKGADRCN
eukprot:TRINITY_DN322_c0_g1_i1.p1 TRINITY_DN322_c0_g1~~TRINITY_DN322_c0_g1_i1.p1  ORF type:complete len:557 (+),score=130.94 TRINITY_DN322_c0_g1_i1:64-1734(+)